MSNKNQSADAQPRPLLRRRRILIAGFLLLVVLFMFLLFREGVIWFNMPPARKYPVRGVDASHYQGQMDWQIIAEQGITFAFLKATEGSGTLDDCFAENWKNARAAGLAVGALYEIRASRQRRHKNRRHVRMVLKLPSACLLSVVRPGIRSFPRHRIQRTPCGALCRIQLPFLFL